MSGRNGYFLSKWPKLENEVVDELTYLHARKTPLGIFCRCCCRCWCKRMNVVAWYLLSILFGVTASILLIAFLLIVIRPHIVSSSYEATTCTVTSSKYDSSRMISCFCPGPKASCFSSYPCLTITVRYKRFDGVQVTTMLYADEYTEPCSYAPSCKKNVNRNTYAVKRYQRRWGSTGFHYSCLYDPSQGSQMVVRERNTRINPLHFWLWLTIIIACCVVTFILTLCTCGWKYHMHKYPPEAVVQIADSLREKGIMRLTDYTYNSRKELMHELAGKGKQDMAEAAERRRVFNPPPLPEEIEFEEANLTSQSVFLSTTV